MTLPLKSHGDYTVGWVCALPKEQAAATAMLDQRHQDLPKPRTDQNVYTLGFLAGHNVVIACLPKGKYGTNQAAVVATSMVATFPSVRIGLMVGIGGGIPPKVRLGDVVVSTPLNDSPGVIQWDMGKAGQEGFKRTGALNNPPPVLLAALSKLEAENELSGSRVPEYLDEMAHRWPRLSGKYLKSDNMQDLLFRAEYPHHRDPGHQLPKEGVVEDDDYEEEEEDTCQHCDKNMIIKRKARGLKVHHGVIASGNQVIKDANFRRKLNRDLGGDVLCVEMEAAGLMNTFPCIVIRGICDYADSHKNKNWQEHAAAVAAAFAKELLIYVAPSAVEAQELIKDILGEVKQVNQGIRYVRKQVEDGFLGTQCQLESLLNGNLRAERTKVLEWLSPVDYSKQQNDYITKSEPGTGQALLRSSEYQIWLQENNKTLFCPGIPGAGKTIQTSILIQDLCTRFMDDPQHTGIGYIFCNFNRQDEQKIERLLGNLLKQLYRNQILSRDCVEDLYKRHSHRNSRPMSEEWSATIQSVVEGYSRVFIVIDALDECQETDNSRWKLLTELFHLQDKTGLNIFVTSRFIPDIVKRFDGCLSLEIKPSHEDVWTYLGRHMSQLPDFVTESMEIQNEVKMEIEKAMDGIFLLAQLYLDSLVGKRSPKALRMALSGLRQGAKASRDGKSSLFEAYEKAIERIQHQRGDLPRDAMLIFSWIVYAKRPLKVLELQHALAVEPGRREMDHGNIPSVNHMIRACAPLVTVDGKSEVIRLVHYTTQEYFEQSLHNWFPEAKLEIARASVAYLSYDAFGTGFCKTYAELDDRKRTYRFFKYAARNWGHHVRESMPPLDTHEVTEFLASASKVSASFQELLQELSPHGGTYLDRYHQDLLRFTPLHLAAYFGLDRAVAFLVKRGSDPHIPDFHGKTALWYASMNGHVEVVKVLIAAGVDLEAATREHEQSPLVQAAKNGHKEVLEALVDAGASLNTCDISQESPLALAVTNAHEAAAEYLLDQGIDTESKGQHGFTPLLTATWHGHIGMVRLLLRKGAAKDTADNCGTTALHWAVWLEHEEVVSILLDHGADLEIENLAGGRPMAAAIEKGSVGIVRILLQKGAAVDFEYYLYRRLILRTLDYYLDNPPFYAVPHGLVWESGGTGYEGFRDAGVNRNTMSKVKQWVTDRLVTPLWRAAEKRDERVIALLLDKRAMLELARDDQHLSRHGIEGNESLEAERPRSAFRDATTGAEKEWWDEDRIMWAVQREYGVLLRLLLETSNDTTNEKEKYSYEPDSKDPWGRTPLTWACWRGHHDMVNLLLASGRVDVNAVDNNGKTPLFYGIAKSANGTAALLLASGKTNINFQDHQGQTALWLAATMGRPSMVELLLEHGADDSVADVEGRTAMLEVERKLQVGSSETTDKMRPQYEKIHDLLRHSRESKLVSEAPGPR